MSNGNLLAAILLVEYYYTIKNMENENTPTVVDLSSYGYNVFVAGDIHGQPQDLAGNVGKADIRDSAIIILGDVGLGFYGNHAGPVKYLHKTGLDRNNHYYIFRGNHDNPASWEHDVADKLEEKYSNIHFLRDMDTLLFSTGEKALIVPGAVSIDRKWAVGKEVRDKDTGELFFKRLPRPEGKCWWSNETIRYDMVDSVKSGYDFVLAHTGPTPPSLRLSNDLDKIAREYDSALPADIDEERKAIDSIIEKSSCHTWINGHYHVETYMPYNVGDIKFEHNGITVINLGISDLRIIPLKEEEEENDRG